MKQRENPMARRDSPEQKAARRQLFMAEREELEVMLALAIEPTAERQVELRSARVATQSALDEVSALFFSRRRR